MSSVSIHKGFVSICGSFVLSIPHVLCCFFVLLQHQNNYNLDVLGDRRHYSLDACIADCDKGNKLKQAATIFKVLSCWC